VFFRNGVWRKDFRTAGDGEKEEELCALASALGLSFQQKAGDDYVLYMVSYYMYVRAFQRAEKAYKPED
jgi:hypothetical protein